MERKDRNKLRSGGLLKKRPMRQFDEQRSIGFPCDIDDGANIPFYTFPVCLIFFGNIGIQKLRDQEQTFGFLHRKIYCI